MTLKLSQLWPTYCSSILFPVTTQFLNKNRFIHSTPSYSTIDNSNSEFLMVSEGKQIVLSNDFIEWFRGFTDAEGCFLLVKIGNNFAFRFLIKLHLDDAPVLDFIQKTLGLGRVTIYESSAIFSITSQKEIQFIIELFTKYPLNSTKHLNFLDFKKAFELYTKSTVKVPELIMEVESIKNNMNSKRIVLEMPMSHQINITHNWLLGFVEGDGSFNVVKAENILQFSITQKGNLALMETIKNFFIDLAKSQDLSITQGFIYITNINIVKPEVSNHVLSIKNNDFIKKILIPFFDSMVWHSKKELDYLDWKTVFKIKELGLHHTTDGKDLIEFILSKMNNNRLSTNKPLKVNRTFTSKEVEIILNGPSNYEKLEDGRILIKSSNKYSFSRKKIQVELIDPQGLVFKTFNTITSCAEFLGVSSFTVAKRIKTNKSVSFKNKEYYIKIL